MKIIKYFFEFIFIYSLLIIFKIIGYKNSSNVPSKAFDTCDIGVRTFTKHIMSSLKDNISSKDVVIESQLDIVRPVSNNPDEDISSIYTCTDSKCLSYCSVCKCCDILEDQCSVCDSNMVDIQEPTFLSRSMSFPCASSNHLLMPEANKDCF